MAQRPPSAATPSLGAAAITPAALGHQLDALAAESLRVRAVPGPELERAARYVADQFRRLGLAPRGDDGNWIQRVPVPSRSRFDCAKSRLIFKTWLAHEGRRVYSEWNEEMARHFVANFASTAYLVPPVDEVLPGGSEEVLVLTGHHTAASVRAVDIGRKLVLYFPPTKENAVVRRQVIHELRAATPRVIIADDQDSARFAAKVQQESRSHLPLIDRYLAEGAIWRGAGWTVAVRNSLLAAFVEATGIDIARARATPAPAAQVPAVAEVEFDAVAEGVDSGRPTVPNVVGVLAGSDSALQDQALLVTARLDDPRGASNVAGLLALAQAFQVRAPPRRTIIFMAVTEGTEQWGSQYATPTGRSRPIAHLAVDLVGRDAGDSVRLYGTSDIEGVESPALIAAIHPELDLTVVDGGTAFQPALRTFASATAGIPSLTLGGGDPGLSAPGEPRSADPAWNARVLQLAYHLAEMLDRADRPPRLSTAGRRHLFLAPANP